MIIDWDKFAERVPLETQTRSLLENGYCVYEGLLIENYPHWQEEMIEYMHPDTQERWRRDLVNNPRLRCQRFDNPGPGSLHLDWGIPQFFMNNRWHSLDEVMA